MDINDFYAIDTLVERATGTGSFGTTYAPVETLAARVRYGARMIRNSNGEQVVSQAHITYPIDTPTIPVDSRISVPSHSTLTRTVIAEERHDTGMPDMPNHYTVDLD